MKPKSLQSVEHLESWKWELEKKGFHLFDGCGHGGSIMPSNKKKEEANGWLSTSGGLSKSMESLVNFFTTLFYIYIYINKKATNNQNNCFCILFEG